MSVIDWDKWQEIISSLKKQKLRTLLTAFGVFWGILMLVVLLGFGSGFGYKVQADFKENNNILLMWSSNKTQLPYRGLGKGRTIDLKPDDVIAVQQKLNSVKMINGKNALGGWGAPQSVTYNKRNSSFSVSGTHAGWLAYEFGSVSRMLEGRYINAFDEREQRKVAVIGTRVKDILFKNEGSPIGKNIDIKGVVFEVIGVFKNYTDEGSEQNDSSIFIPNETLRHAYNLGIKYDTLFILPADGYATADVEKNVLDFLYDRNKIHPDDKGVLRAYNHEETYKQQQNLVKGILGFSWMVAIGTIIAGVIGVGNIMLVIVKERTREIGLRKALGATPTTIRWMIVQESLFITVVSGYAGLVAGVLLLEGIKVVLVNLGKGSGMFSSPFIEIDTAIYALLVLVVSGVLASLLPAMKASSVNPIVALQDE